MQRVLTEHTLVLAAARPAEGAVVGKIVRIDEAGQCLVDFPENELGPVPARLTRTAKAALRQEAPPEGREVLLVFENRDATRPIVVDVLHSLIEDMAAQHGSTLEAERPEDVVVDGKRVVYDAKEEIVLRCGKASITLTRAGKILIRGEYVLSRSSGVNRIVGGSVQLN